MYHCYRSHGHIFVFLFCLYSYSIMNSFFMRFIISINEIAECPGITHSVANGMVCDHVRLTSSFKSIQRFSVLNMRNKNGKRQHVKIKSEQKKKNEQQQVIVKREVGQRQRHNTNWNSFIIFIIVHRVYISLTTSFFVNMWLLVIIFFFFCFGEWFNSNHVAWQ